MQVRHREPEYNYPDIDILNILAILIYLPLIDNEPLVGHQGQRLKIQDHLHNYPLVGSQGSRIILRPVTGGQRNIRKHLREKMLLEFIKHENNLVLKRHLASPRSHINESQLRIFHFTVLLVRLLLGCLGTLLRISLCHVCKPDFLMMSGEMIGDSSNI